MGKGIMLGLVKDCFERWFRLIWVRYGGAGITQASLELNWVKEAKGRAQTLMPFRISVEIRKPVPLSKREDSRPAKHGTTWIRDDWQPPLCGMPDSYND